LLRVINNPSKGIFSVLDDEDFTIENIELEQIQRFLLSGGTLHIEDEPQMFMNSTNHYVLYEGSSKVHLRCYKRGGILIYDNILLLPRCTSFSIEVSDILDSYAYIQVSYNTNLSFGECKFCKVIIVDSNGKIVREDSTYSRYQDLESYRVKGNTLYPK